MARDRWYFPAILVFLLNGVLLGQSRLPEVGSMLPDVTVNDEDGKEFSTESLKGHYSVLVFGCLT